MYHSEVFRHMHLTSVKQSIKVCHSDKIFLMSLADKNIAEVYPFALKPSYTTRNLVLCRIVNSVSLIIADYNDSF